MSVMMDTNLITVSPMIDHSNDSSSRPPIVAVLAQSSHEHQAGTPQVTQATLIEDSGTSDETHVTHTSSKPKKRTSAPKSVEASTESLSPPNKKLSKVVANSIKSAEVSSVNILAPTQRRSRERAKIINLDDDDTKTKYDEIEWVEQNYEQIFKEHVYEDVDDYEEEIKQEADEQEKQETDDDYSSAEAAADDISSEDVESTEEVDEAEISDEDAEDSSDSELSELSDVSSSEDDDESTQVE